MTTVWLLTTSLAIACGSIIGILWAINRYLSKGITIPDEWHGWDEQRQAEWLRTGKITE